MEINSIELHDLPVDGISFNFELEIVRLFCSVYSEEEENYKAKEFAFTGVKNINMESMELLTSRNIEIYHAENAPIADGNKITFTFLVDFGPSFDLAFEYKDVQVL